MKAQHFQLVVTILLGPLLGLALTGCGPREKPLPPEVITALQLRYNENDAKGAAELFTEDGAVMTEFGDTIRGKTAIYDFLRNDLDRRLQYWTTSESSLATGDYGYDFGTLRIRDTAKGQDLETVKYMTLYRKVDGSWKIYRNIFNTSSLAACTSVQVTTPEESANSKTP